jgi:hypothetical protein
VDQAPPDSLILVSPGVYKEAVTVTTDRLVIRGLDRNKVILDGGYSLDNGVKVLGANGVAVENMTARKFTKNGFFWTGVKGYRGSYLTATRTGDYGIFAFGCDRRDLRGICTAQAHPTHGVHRPVLSVRGRSRCGGRVQRARLLRHERGRQPHHHELGLAAQPGWHRPEQR